MTAIAAHIASRTPSTQADTTRMRALLARWTGRTLTGITVAFLLMDSMMKLLRLQVVTDAMKPLGWPTHLSFGLGVLLAICVTLYAVPATAVLGAILLTGYLGGAVSTHLRVGDPLFSHVLFPVYVGLMVWGGLFLRDARLRALIAFRGHNA